MGKGLEGASKGQEGQFEAAAKLRKGDGVVSEDGSDLTYNNPLANKAWREAFEKGFK